MSVPLGATVRDRITGFAGVATGRCTYISGCNQVLVAPSVAPDGAARDSAWFDEQRLDVDPTAGLVVLENGAAPGFDRPAPKR